MNQSRYVSDVDVSYTHFVRCLKPDHFDTVIVIAGKHLDNIIRGYYVTGH